MVRFKVIKGSHLLLAFAVIVLLAVIAFILIQSGAQILSSAKSTAADKEIVQLDTTNEEAKAAIAFASNVSAPVLQIEIIPDAPASAPRSDAPSVLIYHTHTHEAYAQDSEDPYEAIETWRTVDEEHSVVRVGTALADALTSLGYKVNHDTTDH